MKLVIKALTVSVLLSLFSASAQEMQTGVEKSIFTVQTGLLGGWISNEARLSNTIALRTEVGFDVWYYESFWTGEKGSFLAPSISLEPRWYYNIEKRANKGKYTENNSANFVTVAVEYYPDAFTIGNHPDYIYVPNQLTVIPKWGMRRAIAKSNFNYELGAGVGFITYLSDSSAVLNDNSDVAIDLHIRIGYTF